MKNNLTSINRKGALLIMFSIVPFISFASGESTNYFNDPVTIFCVVAMFIALLTLAVTLNMVNTFLRASSPEKSKAESRNSVWYKLTNAVPVEEEETIMTDHVYDGIRELDNVLPPWWKYMFYCTIVFAFVYMYFYHFSDSAISQDEEFKQEVRLAEIQKEEYLKKTAGNIDENNVKVTTDAAALEKGKSIYQQSCSPCHGKEGQGGVGPNLTDEFWLHGGGVHNIFKTIKYGVPQKGMISWKAQLTPVNIQDVTSYIITLKGTNPPNGKEPQGEKYSEEVVANK